MTESLAASDVRVPGRRQEFFYVDVERVRSLLAQLERGVAETLVERTETGSDLEASAGVFGIGAAGSRSRAASREESKSLQDLAFVLFEEAAVRGGLLRDVTEEQRDPEGWSSGAIHRRLNPGEIVWLTCDVQVVDPRFFQARLKRLEDFGDALVGLFNPGAVAQQPLTKAERSRRNAGVAPARRQLWGDVDPRQFESLSQLLSQLLADSISVRVMPCGKEYPQYGYTGSLIGRRDYIQEEREILFSRYGSLLEGWTVVLQIATIPARPTNVEIGFDDLAVADGGSINRAAIETVAVRLNTMLEGIGFSEGPRWPSITASVLGVYRSVPVHRD